MFKETTRLLVGGGRNYGIMDNSKQKNITTLLHYNITMWLRYRYRYAGQQDYETTSGRWPELWNYGTTESRIYGTTELRN